MASEPDGAGAGRFTGSINTPGRFGSKGRTSTISAGFSFDVPGLGEVQKQLSGVSDALRELKSTVAGMSSAFTSGPVVNMLSAIRKEAAATTQTLQELSSSVGAVGGSTGTSRRSAAAAVPSGGGGGPSNGGVTTATQAPTAAIQQAGGSTGTSAVIGQMGTKMGSMIESASGSGLLSSLPIIGGLLGGAADLAMFPLRFTRERIQNNRTQALAMSQELTPYQWATGGTTSQMMRNLSTGQFPGGMQGDVSDVLNALTIGRRVGAQYNFGNAALQNSSLTTAASSQNFYKGVAQLQTMTPGLGAGATAQIFGGQVANVGSQQASAFLTGGAFAMVKTGGRGIKNVAEWSNDILKFLQDQRPGSKRGSKFTYGELLAQNFPGSNINTWFSTVGISAEMVDYWWTYALGQAQTGSADVFKTMAGEGGELTQNQAWRRLGSQNVLARNEFGLAGRMGGQYAQREQSNQWFNQMMGALVNKLVPAMASSPGLGLVQYLPDQVEDFLWNSLESSGDIAQILAGLLGTAGGALGGLGQLVSPTSSTVYPGTGVGDIGDPGDYGMQGGRTTSGLTPDLRSKVDRMMKANPNLRINSGLRDSYTQSKLKKKGIGSFGAGNKSPHSGGWAADIGPSSQYGWLQRNAGKFGLQTATAHGEPWHVQRAGTITPGRRAAGKLGMGDPGDGIGDWNDWIPGSGLVGDAMGAAGTIADLVEMFRKVFGKAIAAFDMAADAAKLFDLKELSKGGVASGVTEASKRFMSLITGGMGGGTGLTSLLGGSDVQMGYDKDFAKGLPSGGSFSLYNLHPEVSYNGITGQMAPTTIQTGGTAARVTGAADLNSIYTKYAGGVRPTSSQSAAGLHDKISGVLSLANQVGFTGDELITAVALSARETGGTFNPGAYNPDSGTGDLSFGLWQINMLDKPAGTAAALRKKFGITSNEELYDPLTNARAMRALFDSSKTPFQAWGPYKGKPPLHGGAEKWIEPIYTIAQAEGYIGDPGDLYGGNSTSTYHVQFHNTFEIKVPGGGSTGVDVNRLVPMIADKLEGEMNRRLEARR